MRRDIQAPNSGAQSLQTAVARDHPVETRSHALQSIIKSGRAVVVAPLITGGYQASTLIATGQYLAALKCAGAAGLAFLLLTVALELADAFVDFRRKKQLAKLRDGETYKE